ncbi:MAG: 2Fe-2S iron-sulfur cluster-binding protein [Pseudomonadales bacterium]|jgi:2Fe-2S ferredoxin|nr:2Fe-2S iron-sulfur cluster-binding protein [Pseudomonadales bacterium]MDP6472348.1 2Fe-2S iron-sulfur cluster-binding protein [Pseudomonadales bacterium]MDP6828144.1 2Fe-2S iron-sulfur cluster-binding protein [Pseudomonadales bacterium]MDP6973471.1 2Fe-2S iron-sulfur cluster-binding protein [Pseudomonadales bacterium]|tara:strand:- start:2670 stop:2990 length:321 start_codon:yes stop_codon:yes gene_type:complete
MPTITYIEHDGTEHQIDAELGTSVMRGAIDNGIPGIDADCGGKCSCATCHVVVTDQWWSKVGTPGDTEESMLDLNPEREPHSRLSCQIKVTDALDGLVVNLPEFQM